MTRCYVYHYLFMSTDKKLTGKCYIIKSFNILSQTCDTLVYVKCEFIIAPLSVDHAFLSIFIVNRWSYLYCLFVDTNWKKIAEMNLFNKTVNQGLQHFDPHSTDYLLFSIIYLFLAVLECFDDILLCFIPVSIKSLFCTKLMSNNCDTFKKVWPL